MIERNKKYKMNLPKEILDKLIELSYKINKSEIAKDFRKISDRYIGEKRGESLLNQDNEAIAYAIARMPATYSATSMACIHTFEILNRISEEKYNTLIDVGAGTGAASLAISEQVDLEGILCLEREDVMMSLGKILLAESENEVVKNAKWEKFDINDYQFDDKRLSGGENKNADIVITSYMLNEFNEDKVLEIVEKLWAMTNKVLIIVEPGTPKDYKRIMKIKEYLTIHGGMVIAPCTNCSKCDLPENDWCNFSCRVERTKMQKDAKLGDAPYEDEKFTYLAIAKFKEKEKNNFEAQNADIVRIIRHPIIKTNMVEVKLCQNGNIINKTYTKKDKEMYKKTRKARVGMILEL